MEFKEYKKLQEEGSGWSFDTELGDQMVKAITSLLVGRNKDIYFIDVGCGEGRGLLSAAEMGYTNIFGVDISTPKIKKAQGYGLVNTQEADIHNLSMFADKAFDLLFCSHTMEHSLDPKRALSECFRISKAGLIIVPIDKSRQPPLGKSPHTSNFSTINEWTNIFDSVVNGQSILKFHESRKRLGHEVWSYWHEV